MSTNVVYLGDVFHLLDDKILFPDKSINCVFSSPPYWPALRDYEIKPVVIGGSPACNHSWQQLPPLKRTSPGDIPAAGSIQSRRPNDTVNRVVKGSEWCECGAWRGQYGHEPTGHMYIDHTMLLFEKFWRILADDGSVWWNIGDAHAGSGGAGGDWNTGKRATAVKWKADIVTNIRDRSLFGTPWRLLAAIIDAGWIVPNVVMWKKKVPYPYSGGRRFTIDYEPIIWAVKSPKYYFKQQLEKRVSKGKPAVGGKKYNDGEARNTNGQSGKPTQNRDDRNMRTTWELETAKCPTNHYASMPMTVPRIPIQATSRKGDVVLDPFNGTGTTCCEAKRQGRRWIGIEMNPEFHAYSEKRIQLQKISGVEITKTIELEAFAKS